MAAVNAAEKKRSGAGVHPRCGGMIELLPPRTRQLLFIPETDVWPRSAVLISADMIMIKEIKLSQPGRSPQGLRHEPWELKGLRRDCSA